MGKIFKFTKKMFKKSIDFVKKYWKAIVITAAVVFTAGIATVGLSGFAGAMGSGGIGGFMSAVGSTMYAGAGAIAGSFGLGYGAQGAAAIAGNVQGVSLGGGHLAAALGSKSAAAGIAAQAAAKGAATPLLSTLTAAQGGAAAAAGGATSSSLASAFSPTLAAGAAPTAGTFAAGASPLAANVGAGAAGGVGGAASNIGSTVFKEAGKEVAKNSLLGDIARHSAGPVISGYMRGKAMEADDPLAQWYVNMDGSAPSFLLPGAIKPDGTPMSEEEIQERNEAYLNKREKRRQGG